MIDDGPADILSLVHIDSEFLGGLNVHLEDPTRSAFDGIPLGDLDLSAFLVAKGWLEGSSGARVDFDITRVLAAPIPEPSALIVFAAGLITAARVRSRHRCR